MLLQPVDEKNASQRIKIAFSDIKKEFNTTQVPLVFKILANFDEYFLFLWEKIKLNLETEFFKENITKIKNLVKKSVNESFYPSKEIMNYVNTLSEIERGNLIKLSENIENTNVQLLIILIAIRESLKGIFIGQTKIEEKMVSSNLSFQIDSEKSPFNNSSVEVTNQVLEKNSSALIIFNTNQLQSSNVSEFFTLFQNEFEKYTSTDLYLAERLKTEENLLNIINDFPYSLGASYQKIIEMIGLKENFTQMLSLLTDYFPSNQPKIVFTAEAMLRVLNPEKGIMIKN